MATAEGGRRPGGAALGSRRIAGTAPWWGLPRGRGQRLHNRQFGYSSPALAQGDGQRALAEPQGPAVGQWPATEARAGAGLVCAQEGGGEGSLEKVVPKRWALPTTRAGDLSSESGNVRSVCEHPRCGGLSLELGALLTQQPPGAGAGLVAGAGKSDATSGTCLMGTRRRC